MKFHNSFLDTNDYKQKILDTLTSFFPIEGKNKILILKALTREDKKFTIQDQKQAKLSGKTLHLRVIGTFDIKDLETGKILDTDKVTIFHVPYYTGGNTLIVGGNELVVGNQRRLRPGIYTKPHEDGTIKSFVNIMNKLNFTVSFTPDTRLLQVILSNHKYPIYSFLRGMGAPENEIEKALGSLYELNVITDATRNLNHMKKIAKDILKIDLAEIGDSEKEVIDKIKNYFSDSVLTPKVVQATLGKAHSKVDYSTLLDVILKIKKVYANSEEADDLDHVFFNQILTGYQRVVESLEKTGKKVVHTLRYRLNGKDPKVKDVVPSGIFDPGVLNFIQSDTITYLNEQINPIQMIDVNHTVSSLGKGGIPSLESVPDDLRHVLPSHTGVLDLIATPESKKAGIDLKLTTSVELKNGEAVIELIDARNLARVKVKMLDLVDKIVVLPGQLPSSKVNENMRTKEEYRKFIADHPSKVYAFKDGMKTVAQVPKSTADYFYISPLQTQTFSSSIIPFQEHMFGARGVMSVKHHGQAMPLKDPEEPLVQTLINGTPANRYFGLGKKAGFDGEVTKVTDTEIHLKGPGSKKEVIELHHHYPLNAKTEFHEEPVVKVGDKVKTGQLLAKNNFSDDKGNLAYGKNLNVTIMPYRGLNHEDGVVISESAAQKLTTLQYTREELELEDTLILNKRKYMGQFPLKYNNTQLDKLDTEGVIQKGATVEMGDPLVLAYSKREVNKLDSVLSRINRGYNKPVKNNTLEYRGLKPAVVTEIHRSPKKITITLSAETPANVGDKIVGRYGNKGSITEILPDDLMPHTAKGEKSEVIFTPAGVPSRINPAQILEGTAGKIARKTGKIYTTRFGFNDNKLSELEKDLKKHKIPDKEILFDPVSKTYTKQPVFTGVDYIMKLHKSVDTHLSSREFGAYDSNEQPIKVSGRPDSSKTFGMMEVNALLAANARENLREITGLKGQKNDEFWYNYKNNLPTPKLKKPFVFDKFEGLLQAAGTKPVLDKGSISLLPMTNKDIKAMSKGEIKNPRLLFGDNEPEEGGLFDPKLTGGLKGENYTHIKLKEPVISPMFKEAISLLLQMRLQDLTDLYQKAGGNEIRKLLKQVDLNSLEKTIQKDISSARGSALNKAIKTLKIIKTLKKNNIKPEEVYILDTVAVIPPKLRPLIPDAGGAMVLSDLNLLYKNILMTNDQFKDGTSFMPEKEVADLRFNLQNNVDKLAGVGYSETPDIAGKKGALEMIAGDQPKKGFFQSNLLSKKMDLIGRGVLTPAPDLNYNEVGVPEKMLWTLYAPFIEKQLRATGMSMTQAKEAIENRTPAAQNILNREIKNRPVLLNRAPSLWRYNIPAAYPVPVSGHAIRLQPLLESGMNADYDGDSINITPPVTDQAVEEARNMTLEHYALSDKRPNDLLASPKQEPILGLYLSSKK